MGVNRNEGCMLYNFVDNHDVERIYTKLNNKDHFVPVHFLLYTLPGIPSVYYGSEYAIEGKKEKFSDASLRPCMKAEDYSENNVTELFKELAKLRDKEGLTNAFTKGGYRQILLTNRQYVFAREFENEHVFIAVNNDENEAWVKFNSVSDKMVRVLAADGGEGVVKTLDTKPEELSSMGNTWFEIKLPPCSGQIYMC